MNNEEELACDDIENVCEQVGLFDEVSLTEDDKIQIFGHIAEKLNMTKSTSSSEIAQIFIEEFEHCAINLNGRLAKNCAEAYLDSYVYNG